MSSGGSKINIAKNLFCLKPTLKNLHPYPGERQHDTVNFERLKSYNRNLFPRTKILKNCKCHPQSVSVIPQASFTPKQLVPLHPRNEFPKKIKKGKCKRNREPNQIEIISGWRKQCFCQTVVLSERHPPFLSFSGSEERNPLALWVECKSSSSPFFVKATCFR